MWVLLIIIFSQPYHVATVDILGTYPEKTVCVKAQKRAMDIGTIAKTSQLESLSTATTKP